MVAQIALGPFPFSPEALVAPLSLIVLVIIYWLRGPIISATGGRPHFFTIPVASLGIAASATLLYLTPNVPRGFDAGTLLAVLPAMMGCWLLFAVFTRHFAGSKSNNHQFSLRSVFTHVLCISLAIGSMSLFQRAADRAARDEEVLQLVNGAKTILSMSTICVDDGFGGIDLIATDPQEAIDLCTKAIELSPTSASAFQTRALAYESMGMTKQADADRTRAAHFD